MDRNKWNRDFDRKFARTERMVSWGIGGMALTVVAVFALIVGVYVAGGYYLVQGVKTIQSQGVKSVVESVWCGEKGCDHGDPATSTNVGPQ